jgi:hypothetical protein
MDAAHRRLGRGRPSATVLTWGQIGVGQTQGFTVELRPGICYSIIAACATDDQAIDLTLHDTEGEELSRSLTTESSTSIEVCPTNEGRFRVMVRMYSGSGAFVIQVFGA